MSYNIDSWRTKKLENLRIPMDAVYAFPEARVIRARDGAVTIEGLPEVLEFAGRIDGETLVVTQLEMYAEFSGHCWDNLKAMLSRSTGFLEAVQVWEGGDSITRLHVSDGDVRAEQVEL